MMGGGGVALLFAAAAASSAACSAAGRPTDAVDEPGTGLHLTDAGSSGSPAGSGSPSADARPADVYTADGNASDASLDGMADGPAAAPRCDSTHAWITTGTPVLPPETTTFGRFGGVSRDELTVAWTASDGTIYVADRATQTATFPPGSVVSTGSLTLAPGRVALSPTGSVLLGVASDRKSLVALERGGRSSSWAPSLPSAYATLNGMGGDPGNGSFFEPAFGLDGLSLFYLVMPPNAAPALFESRWDPSKRAWQSGTGLSNPELASADAMHRRRPTGASSDGLTLFFFDETSQTERAAWRPSVASPFANFVDLSFAEAAPNYLCDSLYYQDDESAPTGIDFTR